MYTFYCIERVVYTYMLTYLQCTSDTGGEAIKKKKISCFGDKL